MSKKKPKRTIKIGRQEFHLSKGSSLFSDGRSKANVKEDVKWFSSRGFHARTQEFNGKHYLYLGKKKKKKVGMVRKLLEEHDRNVKPTPQPTPENRRSRFGFIGFIIFAIGVLIVGVVIGIGFLLNYLGIIGG